MSRRLVLAGAALVALIGAGQALHDGSDIFIGSQDRLTLWLALQLLAGGIYLFVAAGELRAPSAGRAFWLILGVAAAMRAIPLASPMFLSSDLFRYIWDGRVQLAGHNPYSFVPADPVLAPLRDHLIYGHVNRAGYAHTIYPPAAQLVFAAVAWLGQTPFAMRAAMVAFEALGLWALVGVLDRLRLPRSRVLLYAWNPLPVWEFAGNGHLDAIVVGLLGVALLSRARGWRGATGLVLGLAVLVKFLPAVLAPAFWRRWDWRMAAAGLGVIVALYACYAGAGWRVLGFLPGYASEEGLATGDGFWLLAGLGQVWALPPAAGAVFLALLAAGLLAALWVLSARPFAPPHDVARDLPAVAAQSGWLIAILLVALSPHYPWYYAWVCVPAVIAPQRSALFLGVASLLFYLDPLHERFIWPALVFVPTLALAILDIRRPLSRAALPHSEPHHGPERRVGTPAGRSEALL